MSTRQIAEADGLTAHVASEIRAMMGRLNVNRAELARRLGVEDSWVGKRLNGRTEISLTDFDRIARALNVGIVDLLPRGARGTTLTFADSPAAPVARVGASPWPDHPIAAGAVRVAALREDSELPARQRKTFLTGR